MLQAEDNHTPSAPAIASEVVPVAVSEWSGRHVQTVNARDLHGFLEVKRDFPTWMRGRIDEYGFVDDIDFTRTTGFSPNRGKTSGGRPGTEYHLSLDMAKELAMVERNERGRQARRYFIECERIAKESLALQVAPVPRRTANTLPPHHQPMRDLPWQLSADGVLLPDAARSLGISYAELRRILTALGWLLDRPTARMETVNDAKAQVGLLKAVGIDAGSRGKHLWQVRAQIMPKGLHALQALL